MFADIESDKLLKDYRRTVTAAGYKLPSLTNLSDTDITSWELYRNDSTSSSHTLSLAIERSVKKVNIYDVPLL